MTDTNMMDIAEVNYKEARQVTVEVSAKTNLSSPHRRVVTTSSKDGYVKLRFTPRPIRQSADESKTS
jgi:hypothetical protein